MQKQQDVIFNTIMRLEGYVNTGIQLIEQQQIVQKVEQRAWVKQLLQKPYILYFEEVLRPFQNKIMTGIGRLYVIGGVFGILKFLGALTAIGFRMKLSIGTGIGMLIFRIIGGLFSVGVLTLGVGLINKKVWMKSLLFALFGATGIWLLLCLIGTKYGQGDVFPKIVALVLDTVLAIFILIPNKAKKA